MWRIITRTVLLLGALNLGLCAYAQSTPQLHWTSTDLAVTYTTSLAKPAFTSGTFWMPGAGVNGSFNLYHGLGVAGSFIGEHRTNDPGNINFTKLSFIGGPRYTYELKKKKPNAPSFSAFGESLFGTVHAYDGVYPNSSGTKSSATAFTMEIGGGVNMEIAHGLGLRLMELHYVRSALPNGGNNTQNDFRLSTGVSFRIWKH